jgi:predicted HNH restriction endonuclease
MNQVYKYGKNTLLAVERSGKKCEKCGDTKNLQIHHKDNKGSAYLKKGLEPNNNLNNLMVLCISCHRILHGELARKAR